VYLTKLRTESFLTALSRMGSETLSICCVWRHYEEVSFIHKGSQNQIVAQRCFLICSQICNMFRPDSLAIFRDAHAAVFPLTIIINNNSFYFSFN